MAEKAPGFWIIGSRFFPTMRSQTNASNVILHPTNETLQFDYDAFQVQGYTSVPKRSSLSLMKSLNGQIIFFAMGSQLRRAKNMENWKNSQ